MQTTIRGIICRNQVLHGWVLLTELGEALQRCPLRAIAVLIHIWRAREWNLSESHPLLGRLIPKVKRVNYLQMNQLLIVFLLLQIVIRDPLRSLLTFLHQR